MRTVDTRRITSLSYWVDVEINDEDDYNRLKEWINNNVPTTDRRTPKWDNGYFYINEPEPTKIRFGFRYEEDAMAFKLILNTYN